jgi:SAM-dependent methyltransferase
MPGLRILDVGCGGGRDLLRLKELGCEVRGVEPDPAAAEAARALGLRVQTGTIHDLRDSTPCFDAISLIHVIEHVPDPVPTLQRAAGLLHPGGRLLALTPNAESWSFRLFRGAWYALDAPRHVQVFTPGSLAEACRRAGLKDVRMRTRSQPRVVRDSLGRTERRLAAALARTTPGRGATRLFGWTMAAVFGCGEELEVVAYR